MLRTKKFQTVAILAVIACATIFLRLGTGPSLFERLVAVANGIAGGTLDNTLLPFGDKEQLKREARSRREEAARLLRENTFLRQEILRLGFAKKVGLPPGAQVSRIVGRDPSAWARKVTVDKGTSQGIKPGFMATTHGGLAGRAVACSKNTCSVRLIIDPGEPTSCMVARVRKKGADANPAQPKPKIYCMAYGNASQTLDVVIVSAMGAAYKGDRVFTSGFGDHYPPGMPVGVISGKARSKRLKALGFEVRPHVDFKRMDYLLLSPP